ncbi:hypothetical protein [Kribbella sp. NPDC048928]|uniref:hypothetical protein n=1 Tax=Kribbella sp. NPDC048928 TaxID=3364111 RepID=UPI00371881FA
MYTVSPVHYLSNCPAVEVPPLTAAEYGRVVNHRNGDAQPRCWRLLPNRGLANLGLANRRA